MRTSWATLGNCVAPSVNPGRYLVFTAMLFGFKGAPLIMGRFAAMLARLLQSLMPADEMQSQLYMGDPLWILQGPRWRRRENLALILYMCGALGVKVAVSQRVRWNRCGLDRNAHGAQAGRGSGGTFPSRPKMMNEVKSTLESWHNKGMVPLGEARAVTGKLSGGVNILYAIISDFGGRQNGK